MWFVPRTLITQSRLTTDAAGLERSFRLFSPYFPHALVTRNRRHALWMHAKGLLPCYGWAVRRDRECKSNCHVGGVSRVNGLRQLLLRHLGDDRLGVAQREIHHAPANNNATRQPRKQCKPKAHGRLSHAKSAAQAQLIASMTENGPRARCQHEVASKACRAPRTRLRTGWRKLAALTAAAPARPPRPGISPRTPAPLHTHERNARNADGT